VAAAGAPCSSTGAPTRPSPGPTWRWRRTSLAQGKQQSYNQGVTKRCRLSLLTAPSYTSPNAGGWGVEGGLRGLS
jgi:hypothetical protein